MDTICDPIVADSFLYLLEPLQWLAKLIMQFTLEVLCVFGLTHLINVREYRRGNQKWTIQRNWQHRVHKTMESKQTKTTTQYVLDTPIRKEAQNSQIRYSSSHIQLETKMNRTSFSCGNRNGHHNTELGT